MKLHLFTAAAAALLCAAPIVSSADADVLEVSLLLLLSALLLVLSFVPVPSASHHLAQIADSLHLYFFHPSRSYSSFSSTTSTLKSRRTAFSSITSSPNPKDLRSG